MDGKIGPGRTEDLIKELIFERVEKSNPTKRLRPRSHAQLLGQQKEKHFLSVLRF